MNTDTPRLRPDGCFHCVPPPDRVGTTRCTPSQLARSVDSTPDCQEFINDADRIFTRPPPQPDRCAPRCVHPVARCLLEDRLICDRQIKACAADETPEFPAGRCCPSCYVHRPPVCTPACAATHLCVRSRTANDGTGVCLPSRLYRLRLRAAAAVRAAIGGEFTPTELRAVISHLVYRNDGSDNAVKVDTLRERLEAACDSARPAPDDPTATVEIRIADETAVKRQGSSETLLLINEAACQGAGNSTDSTPTNCELVASPGATTASSTGNSGVSTGSSTVSNVGSGAQSITVQIGTFVLFLIAVVFAF